MRDMKEYLKQIDEVIEKGPYRDDWDSLSAHPLPKWFQKGKFGIFYPLGRLQRAGVRQRVVLQEHVYPGESGI